MTIVDFLTGLIVGTLLGLALAPVLQAWIAWRIVQGTDTRRDRDRLLERLVSRL
jgi:hypothetical protein